MRHRIRSTFESRSDWLRKCVFGTAFLTLVGSTGLTVANAQIQFPVALPTPKVGDVARYRTVDLWNNSELYTLSQEVIEATNDGLMVRNINSSRPEPTTLNFNREWQPCRAMRRSNEVVCTGVFKFPMQTGNKYTYEKLPWGNGSGHSTASCEVKGEEKVTVPAGTFDSVRIECSGFWTRVFDGTGSGRQTEAFWYAPSIHRFVKSQFSDTFGGGASNTKNQTELVEFTAGK